MGKRGRDKIPVGVTLGGVEADEADAPLAGGGDAALVILDFMIRPSRRKYLEGRKAGKKERRKTGQEGGKAGRQAGRQEGRKEGRK
jgi:hypothetical protein